MIFSSLNKAVEELRRKPDKLVRAHCGDLDVELRVVDSTRQSRRIGDFLASLGPWEGESTEELSRRLAEARRAGGSDEPPRL